MLAQAGVPIKVLQYRLGQSTSRVTLDYYTHLGATDGRGAADVIGVLLTVSENDSAGTMGANGGTIASDGPAPPKRRAKKQPFNTGISLVGHPGLEPGTSCLSSMRSNQLS